ncbi:MAG: dihydrolipoyl dehydrogenase family protein [Pseudonocardiaceae bacterium]
MVKRFDLVVLGTGAGASTVATKCRSAGWSVAIVDALPYGGTCALRGCDPKKVLVGAAEVVDAVRRFTGHGVSGDTAIRWPELMLFKRTFTEPVPENRERALAEAGIATFHGRAHFVGATTVAADGAVLEAHHVHVATGAKPADLKLPGSEYLTTSDQFLELDALPTRILFVGGGYVSFELAHVAARAGARVTVVHRGQRPLERFDPDLVAMLVERTRHVGIDLRLGMPVETIEKTDGGFRVTASSEGKAVTFTTDMVVHGAGRVPAIDELDLDTAGVEHDKRGIAVNEYMQSVSNPAVYAAGDAARGGLPLTPVASFESHVAASNLLDGNHLKIEYPPIPSVVFTLPPLASVGLREDEARAQGRRFRVNHQRTSSWYSSRRVGEEFSGYKVLLEENSDRILGAHLLGPHADELINLFALAMRAGMTSRDLKQAIFAYPTVGSDMPHML